MKIERLWKYKIIRRLQINLYIWPKMNGILLLQFEYILDNYYKIFMASNSMNFAWFQ